MRESPTETYAWVKRVGTLLSIPLTLGLAPVIGGAIGWGMDRLLKTRPIFTLLMLGIGFIAGIRETWVLIQRASESEKDEEGNAKDRDHHR